MRNTVPKLLEMAQQDEKIAMLTCYDYTFASVLDATGIDAVLVGDSLGSVIQGQRNTLGVKLDDIVYHTRCVAAGCERALIIADLPFGTYQENPEQAYRSAAQLIAAGAQMVKLEGGALFAPTVRFLVERGIPVCGHIGLMPQSVHHYGGYKIQGRSESAALQLLTDGQTLVEAGASMMVLELIDAGVAARLAKSLPIPLIGIGAGVEVDGQVLVLQDMLGIYPGKRARFVRDFMAGADSISGAVTAYVTAVKAGEFPTPEHGY